MIHRRSDKNSHLDTILYEIDMLRHCSKTVTGKKARASESDDAQAEYNLVIEGFLIHLRNLLGFFAPGHSMPTDLRLNRPETWSGRSTVNPREYSDLIKGAKQFNDRYSEMLSGKKHDCYQLISKFLQHCTPERYDQAVMGWEIDKMFAEIEPILIEFEKRFPPAARTSVLTRTLECSYTTSTLR
jgi:hypothetical protein